jgi:hypothetical protein
MSLLTHWYYMVRAFGWLLLAFGRASWYFQYRALHELQLPHADVLTSTEKRRLKHYFYGTTYLSILFCCLRGRSRTAREKHIFTNLAALAYFFDDLADCYHQNNTLFERHDPVSYAQAADERGLSLHFLENILREMPPANKPQFQDYLQRVFRIETEGRQAAGAAALTPEQMEHVTAEKGGYSVLMFRRVLAHPLSAEEEQAWYAFGYLIQCCDDIFDVWFDVRDGVRSTATEAARSGDIAGLQALFERQVTATRQALRNTPYPPAQRETALRAMHVIVCVTRVCLRHYLRLSPNKTPLPIHDRKAMVVDMEQWRHRVAVGWRLAFHRE